MGRKVVSSIFFVGISQAGQHRPLCAFRMGILRVPAIIRDSVSGYFDLFVKGQRVAFILDDRADYTTIPGLEIPVPQVLWLEYVSVTINKPEPTHAFHLGLSSN